ncbi:MAG: hypothetical protein IK005_02155 [Paludibacteraceae bacterium]|nr:hypothetical protein [Paludibacteraceae bacterium]
MKRLISTTFLFLSLFVFANAQDVIITKDKLKIEAKVTKVNKNFIEYKYFDKPDGETKKMLKSEIVSIAYENGIVEVYNNESSENQYSAPRVTQRIGSDCSEIEEITYKGSSLVYKNRALSNKETINLMKNCKPEYFKDYKSGQHRMVSGIVVTSVGLGLCAVGGMCTLISYAFESYNEDTEDWEYERDDDTYHAGIGILLTGAVITTVGVPLWVSGAGKKNQAIQEFKESFSERKSSYSEPIHLDLVSHKNNIGLALKF